MKSKKTAWIALVKNSGMLLVCLGLVSVVLISLACWIESITESGEMAGAFAGAGFSFMAVILHDLWRDTLERYRKAFNAGVHLEAGVLRILAALDMNLSVCKARIPKAKEGLAILEPRFEALEILDAELTDLFDVDEANRFAGIFHGVRAANASMVSLDRIAEGVFQAVMAGKYSISASRADASSLLPPRLVQIEEDLTTIEAKCEEAIAYLRVRHRNARPGWLRALLWSWSFFDPIPKAELVALELERLRKELNPASATPPVT